MIPKFIYFDGFEAQQHKEELDWMLDKCKGALNFIEIGTHKGGVFHCLCEIIKGKRISIDFQDNVFGNPEHEDMQKRLSEKFSDTHFINADSHHYDILEQVESILNGELVDVLFVDGDHSEEGVRRDYEMYKRFVTNGGLIFFHDISDTKLHADLKCFVHKFWNNLPEPKQQIKMSKEWGGIGCIINKKVKWECYQIYFDEQSKKTLLPIFEPYFNKIKNTEYFENDVIIDINNNIASISADYVGTCSHKFSSKTGFKTIDFIEKVEATNCNYDVLLFPPPKYIKEDVVQRNKMYYSAIYRLMELFDKEKILPFNMLSEKWTCSYCNFWMAKKEVYKDYVETILKPSIKALKKNENIIEFCKEPENQFMHGGKPYPLYPFLMECLMGFYVNYKKIKHKIINESAEVLNSNYVWVILKTDLNPSGKKCQFPKEMAEQLKITGALEIL